MIAWRWFACLLVAAALSPVHADELRGTGDLGIVIERAAGSLHRIVAIYPNVAIGSYPITSNAEYSVIVTAESRDKGSVDKAVEELLAVLPREAVVRVE